MKNDNTAPHIPQQVCDAPSKNNSTAWIEIWGARVHNLKNIDLRLPRHALTVMTGRSGSGKSSLAFDTIYAEGQRRYIETFSAYARNFLDNIERPDVDKITGLSPVISIEQKTTSKNPRSTVGTVTEIYDYLRLLYARAGEAYSYESGEKMVKYTEEQILERLLEDYADQRIFLLAPLVQQRKGHYKELFETIRKKGFVNVRVDGQMRNIESGMRLDRYKNHDIEVVIDKLRVQPKDAERLKRSLRQALLQGNGLMLVLHAETDTLRYFSKRLMCPSTGLAYREPAPHNFSFNSTQGACPKCKGLGLVHLIDKEKICPDPQKNIKEGGIVPLGKYKNALIFWEIEALLKKYACHLTTPIGQLPEEAMDELINGTTERLRIPAEVIKSANDYYVRFEGLTKYIQQMADAELSDAAQKWAEQFSSTACCPICKGQRLNKEALSYRFGGKNIAELSDLDLAELAEWLQKTANQLTGKQSLIAAEILKEIHARLNFLLEVGLDYLSLSRSSMTLSGGESQRIRLATQIGSQLVNVLYILDEPSIGLHQRDNMRLIRSLQRLRDVGNSIIVVEHDKDMMLAADYIVDIGPEAGLRGGEVVFQGSPKEMLNTSTLTAKYLNGERSIAIPPKRRKGNGTYFNIFGARGNNLQNVNVSFPLGTLIGVTGVSGSGKSTLINDTLLPILSQHFYRSLRAPLPYDSHEGIEHLDKVVAVDQSPLGRSPRSNPATYTGVFNDIRNLFVHLPESKIRAYKQGRFSFNVKGGRCETCKGTGYKTIEMNFLPNVYVPCEVCHGKRYNRETLEVRFKGKSISDVLDLTINQAVDFFEHVPNILHKIKVLQEVGLGYLKLGQPCTTLSGGESQRVKLATELAKRDTGRTMYILDEPTTGLHFEDIRVLVAVLQRLVDKGNTVVVIEHNLDLIKVADHLIDLGPEGGRRGGIILAEGTPEAVSCHPKSPTASFIAEALAGDKHPKQTN